MVTVTVIIDRLRLPHCTEDWTGCQLKKLGDPESRTLQGNNVLTQVTVTKFSSCYSCVGREN